MSSQVRGYLAIVYLALCLVLGGASAAGAIANAILQLLAIVIILLLLWTRRVVVPAEARPLAWIVGLFLLLGLISLVPLPAGVWQSLPYRNEIAEGLRMLGIGDVSMPASLAPRATIASLLWLLPPAAMFLLSVSIGWDERRRLCGTVVILAVLSILLGVFQLVGGSGSALRFYEITNEGSPVGLFANINHQATLILCAVPCIAVIATQFATRSDRSKRSGGMIIASVFGVFLLGGIAISGSMAGYGLAIPAAFASLLIYRRAVAGPIGARWKAGFAALLVVVIALALVGPLSRQSLSGKFADRPASRGEIAMTTLRPIADSFPVGTGLGSFAQVYRRYEDPRGASGQFVNHAHNDYLEVALELGLPGMLLVAAFLLWWARRSIYAWRMDFRGSNMARAGSAIVGLVLLHSLVDYPVRTSAMASVFAVACAFLVPYVASGRRRRTSAEAAEAQDVRHLEAV